MDVDERTRASIEMPIFCGFLGLLGALITARSRVRLLPGAPHEGETMRVIADRVEQPGAPLMRLYIHDAPHRRMHMRTIQQFREVIRTAVQKAGFNTPIAYPIELSVVFVNPSSPDLDNLLTALFLAFDGATLKKS